MAVLHLVNPGRFLDGVVFAFFLMVISGLGLYIFGEFHKFICLTEAKRLGYVAKFFSRAFPFPKDKFVFNLTHILLFGILVAVLSMMHHPAQDHIEQNAMNQKKKESKKDKKETDKAQ